MIPRGTRYTALLASTITDLCKTIYRHKLSLMTRGIPISTFSTLFTCEAFPYRHSPLYLPVWHSHDIPMAFPWWHSHIDILHSIYLWGIPMTFPWWHSPLYLPVRHSHGIPMMTFSTLFTCEAFPWHSHDDILHSIYLWGIPMMTFSTPFSLDLSMMVLSAGMSDSQPSSPNLFSDDHFLCRNSSNLQHSSTNGLILQYGRKGTVTLGWLKIRNKLKSQTPQTASR